MKSVALIGAGRMAGVHARHLRSVGVEELIVFDGDAERGRAFAAAQGGTAVESLDEAIARVDLVAALVPNLAHREVAERAIEAGKPTFVEKPIASNLDDAEAIGAAADRSGAFVAIGHVARFFPGYAEAATRVRAGGLGEIATVRMRRGGGLPGANGVSPWYADHAKSGGVFVDLAIHDFDWLLWTCGPAARVHARSVGAARGEGPDHGLATVTLASGAIAHVEATWMDPGPFRMAFDVAGSGGALEYDSRLAASVRTATSAELPMGAAEDPYARQWRAIRDALASGAPPPVGVGEATAALRLAHAALASARSGEPVELDA